MEAKGEEIRREEKEQRQQEAERKRGMYRVREREKKKTLDDKQKEVWYSMTTLSRGPADGDL